MTEVQGAWQEWRPGSDGEHELQRNLGTAQRADRFYTEQVLDHLNARMWEFTERQEMFFLATSDRHGECDSSFRAGPPGFLRVLDEHTLVYPEYRGNGVHASLGNLRENPHLGLLLMDFTADRIGLHINGHAELVEDAELRAHHPDLPVDPVPGRRTPLWVRVTVQEAYIHCAKHIPRLRKVSKEADRDWGTDDVKRKGGDFFGAARDARGAAETRGTPEARDTAATRGAAEVRGGEEERGSGTTRRTGGVAPEPAAGQLPTPRHGSATPVSQPGSWASSQQSAAAGPVSGPAERDHLPEAAPATEPEPAAAAAGPAPDAREHGGSGAAAGANGPAEWRMHAERVLAEAQRRGNSGERSTFQGWFG